MILTFGGLPMVDIRMATDDMQYYFVNDYLNRFGPFEDLAKRYAKACVYSNRTLVAIQQGKIFGGITWSIKEGINSGMVEIFQMSILEPYRGKGYGSILVDNCLKDIETFYASRNYPLQRIYISITESNIIGRNLYRNKGFHVAASLKHHRINHNKDLLYVKDYGSRN